MRRGAGTIGFAVFAAADSAAIAVTAPAAPPPGASPVRGAAAACSVTAVGAAGASATGGAATTGALTAIFSSRAAGATGGFTTTPAGGGATTITGRAGATPATGFATTGPTGGRDAMAGVDGGGATIGGAERGCGTILRGSSLAGKAAAGFATIGAAAAGAAGLAVATTVGFDRHARVTRLFFFFLLLGQKSLHHIAGLGDVRKIDLGDNGFRAVPAGCRAAMRAGVLRLPRKVRANLLRLVQLQRAAVRLPGRNADFRKNVENRPRLDFQLFREIVDTNLTHPPLFNLCRQKVFSRS